MKPSSSRLPAFLLVLALLALTAYLGWRYFLQEPAAVASTAPLVEAPVDALANPEETPDEVAQVEAPGIENPIEELEPDLSAEAPEPMVLPALGESGSFVQEQLGTLFSQRDLLTYLQLDGFVRKSVATVDNLARPQAASRLWPVTPTSQRFSTQVGADGVEVIHPTNSSRYAPMVRLIESVDSAQAVAVYRGLYPLFQQAYEELGFPDGYFNDRLVQVLDHLIATPVPTEPPAVALVAVKGTVASLRPWVRYEFVDPALEAQSAGRKILMRVGAENQRRLQAKLKDLRQRVAKP